MKKSLIFSHYHHLHSNGPHGSYFLRTMTAAFLLAVSIPFVIFMIGSAILEL